MKRFLSIAALIVLAVTSIVLAQTGNQATLRMPAGDKPVAVSFQNGQTYVSVDDMMAALGGSVARDSAGSRVTLSNTVAAFGPDSRFGVIRDELIEMPAVPIIVDQRTFIPWQFFEGFLRKAAGQEVAWDPATKILQVRPQQHAPASMEISVANIQGMSKVVMTLTAPVEYTIAREPGVYTFRFKTAIHPPFAEQAYDDPYVTHVTFSGAELRIQLSGPDVAGDAYKLENPFRIILDLQRGTAPPATGKLPITGSPGPPSQSPGIHTIVLDPGHGGKDVGALGANGLLEKDATLAVCHKLAASLSRKLNARVILTREDDRVTSLDQRTAIANQYKADLFLSVHMNAAVVKGAHGSETYFLSVDASDELARKAAEVENSSSKSSNQAPAEADLKMILWDLAQQEYLSESSRLAQAVQEEMNRATGVLSRGVKQAPFKVLVGATMPAALVEVAFITNADEEAKLRSDEFQSVVVEALTRAVQRYKNDYETRIGVAQPAPMPDRPAVAPAPAPAPAASSPVEPVHPAASMPAVKRTTTK